MMITLNFCGDIADLADGIKEISVDMGFELGIDGITVKVIKGKEISVFYDKNIACITYTNKIQFFRELSILLPKINHSTAYEKTEKSIFDTNGMVFDASRNAVFTVEKFKYMLRKMALMGLNTAMLYTEDTYKVDKYPFFGYMRGAYTKDEIKELDDYAFLFGIELIPCIQTLGHLSNVLKWDEMSKFSDLPDILLCDNDETYELLEEMIKSASEPCRSNRIHIGMDEANMLGLGKYLRKNGYTDGFDIISRHLIKVVSILKKYNLKPMIWSDMYFRLASKSGNYYDTEGVIPKEIIDLVPKEIEMVYWDYYNDDEEKYETFIKKHMQFKNNIVFAGGLWTWISPAMHNGEAFRNSIPALKQCQKCGIKEVFATLWGDNGAEADMTSALLAMQLYAEYGYSDSVSMADIYHRFEECVNENAEDFLSISLMDVISEQSPADGLPPMEDANFTKFLLYQDVLIGLFDKDIVGIDFNTHYKTLALAYKNAGENSKSFKLLFKNHEAMAAFLSVKADLGNIVTTAYLSNDRKKLEEVAKLILPEAQKLLTTLINARRELWLSDYKPFGFEVIDIRMGGIMARLETAQRRILDYVEGRVLKLDELEAERLNQLKYTDKNGNTAFRSQNGWQKIISGSAI